MNDERDEPTTRTTTRPEAPWWGHRHPMRGFDPMTEDDDETRGSRRGGPRRRGPGGRGGPGSRGRGRRGPGGRGRANRGDVRAAVLSLLAEEPMHGYQIMQELTERTNGAWRPSPGAVYPALQQLADEGLVSSDDQDGRRVFELTDEGRAAAEEAGDEAPPWERLGGAVDLRQAVASVAAAAMQVGTNGTPEQLTRAEQILTDTRKKLYQLLAE